MLAVGNGNLLLLHELAFVDPEALLRFYLQEGQRRGHSPNLLFDEAWFLRAYPDLAAAFLP